MVDIIKNIISLTDLSGPVDGIYGKDTRDAVKAFQRSLGVLKADGVIGVRTWDALFLM